MGKVFYDKQSGRYREIRYSIVTTMNEYGDKRYQLYDDWNKVWHGVKYFTRAEASKEAKRLEKLCGALCPAQQTAAPHPPEPQ